MPFALTPRQIEAREFMGGPQRSSLLVGGSRSGKTTLICRAIIIRALRAEGTDHALIRHRANTARASLWLGTVPKVLRLCFPGLTLKPYFRDGFAELPNQSKLHFIGLDDEARVEKVLGSEFLTTYFNKSSQILWPSYNIMRTRLAQTHSNIRQREFCDLNPASKAHWTFRQFVEKRDPETRRPLADPHNYGVFYLNPIDNGQNLDAEYLQALQNMPERHKRRFWRGEFSAELDGALWPQDVLDRCKIDPSELPAMRRVVIGVDPSGSRGPEDRRDAIGIIAAGLGEDGRGYVLGDWSVKASPEQWGRRVIEAFRAFQADLIVAETNFGADLVRANIHAIDKAVPFKAITAHRAKHVRAEPISTLYANGQVYHLGDLADLETELADFASDGFKGDHSPDRADAAVHALTELLGVGKSALIIRVVSADGSRSGSDIPKITPAPEFVTPAPEPGWTRIKI